MYVGKVAYRNLYCMPLHARYTISIRGDPARLELSVLCTSGMNYARNFFDIKSGPVRHRDKNISRYTKRLIPGGAVVTFILPCFARVFCSLIELNARESRLILDVLASPQRMHAVHAFSSGKRTRAFPALSDSLIAPTHSSHPPTFPSVPLTLRNLRALLSMILASPQNVP